MRRGGSREQEHLEIIRCKVGGFLHLLESGNDLTPRRVLTCLRTRFNTTLLCRRDIHGYTVANRGWGKISECFMRSIKQENT